MRSPTRSRGHELEVCSWFDDSDRPIRTDSDRPIRSEGGAIWRARCLSPSGIVLTAVDVIAVSAMEGWLEQSRDAAGLPG